MDHPKDLQRLIFLSFAVAPLSAFFSHPGSLYLLWLFVCHSDPKICVLCSCVKTRRNCIEQAGGRHKHCGQQHVHTDSCFICVGGKTILVFSIQESMLLGFCKLS